MVITKVTNNNFESVFVRQTFTLVFPYNPCVKGEKTAVACERIFLDNNYFMGS